MAEAEGRNAAGLGHFPLEEGGGVQGTHAPLVEGDEGEWPRGGPGVVCVRSPRAKEPSLGVGA